MRDVRREMARHVRWGKSLRLKEGGGPKCEVEGVSEGKGGRWLDMQIEDIALPAQTRSPKP